MTDSAAAAPDPDMVAAAAFDTAPHPLAVLRLASAGAEAARYDVVAANAAARGLGAGFFVAALGAFVGVDAGHAFRPSSDATDHFETLAAGHG